MSKVTFRESGFIDVTCDEPSPCPFCGFKAVLCQVNLKHLDDVHGVFPGEKFWFQCSNKYDCFVSMGHHSDTAQEAVELWNKRYPPHSDDKRREEVLRYLRWVISLQKVQSLSTFKQPILDARLIGQADILRWVLGMSDDPQGLKNLEELELQLKENETKC